VFGRPTCAKEVSEFPWAYDEPETCRFLEGDVLIKPDGGKRGPDRKKGDLVAFPSGMSCIWKAAVPGKEHNRFG